MSQPWILVCPSSRGIGHALVRRLLATTRAPILATTRSAAGSGDDAATRATLLNGLPENAAERLSLVRCDVTDEVSVREAARRAAALFPTGTHHLRLACALPGILRPEKSTGQVDAAASLESFAVNSVGPLLLMKHFGTFLPRHRVGSSVVADIASSAGGGGGNNALDDGGRVGDGRDAFSKDEGKEAQHEQHHNQHSTSDRPLPPHATWLTVSARLGSTADNRAGGWYSYRASKAAAASITKTFDIQLRARCGDAALAISYHPGTVRTDLSRAFWASVERQEGMRLLSPDEAAACLVDVVAGLRPEQRGRTWDWKGKEVPP